MVKEIQDNYKGKLTQQEKEAFPLFFRIDCNFNYFSSPILCLSRIGFLYLGSAYIQFIMVVTPKIVIQVQFSYSNNWTSVYWTWEIILVIFLTLQTLLTF